MDIRVDDNVVIVFDLDDTLYNELDFLKSAYRDIAEYLDPEDWKILYTLMFSLYRCNKNVFQFVSDKYKVDIKVLIEKYRNHKPNIELSKGVLETLNAIKSSNGKIGIITDGRVTTQNNKIESLGISNLIDAIVISERIGSEKPDLANYKAIEKDIKGTTYYYIADNLKKDFVTPNASGWKTVGLIDNGKNIHFEAYEYLNATYQPQEFILDFSEINII